MLCMSSRSVPCILLTPCACCRKVAVPVPDNYTWQDFLQQVLTRTSGHSDNLSTASHLLTSLGHNVVQDCTLQVQQKLKLSSVESVTLASVSQQIFTMPDIAHAHSVSQQWNFMLCAALPDLGCHLQSGEQITALDDLQDIDELHVTEVSL